MNAILRRIGKIFGATLLLMLLFEAAEAHAITINFDDISTGPSGVTSITDQYSSLGVVFSLIKKDGSNNALPVVRDSLWGNGAYSSPNSAAFGFDGAIAVATFVDPLTHLDGVTDFFSAILGDRSGEADPMRVLALDLSGQVIGQRGFTSQPTNVLGVNNFGLVSLALAGIHQLLFIDGSPSGADFDNLTFHTVTSGGASVPEPATLMLLASALAGTGFKGRRRASHVPSADPAPAVL